DSDAGRAKEQYLVHADAHDRGARPSHGDRAPHGWCSWRESESQRIDEASALGSCGRPNSDARALRSKRSSRPEKEVGWRSGRDAGCGRLTPGCRIPDSDRKSCSPSCEKSQPPCKVPPSVRRLAGEQQTAFFRPSPNTPSKASLPPFTGESVTYVSGTMCYLCLRPLSPTARILQRALIVAFDRAKDRFRSFFSVELAIY